MKAIKATSSVRSGRASGSGAAATTHLTSPPTAPSLPLCGCAPGWTIFYSGGARPAPMRTYGRSQLWAPLAAKDQLVPLSSALFLLAPLHWPLQLQPQNNSRKGRTLVLGQDRGPVASAHPLWLVPTNSLPFLFPWTPVYGGRKQRDIQKEVIHISKTLASIGRGLGLLKSLSA